MDKPILRLTALFLTFILICSFIPYASADSSGELYFDGNLVESGTQVMNGIPYASLTDITNALGISLEHIAEDNSFSFPWRKSEVKVSADSDVLVYLDSERDLTENAVLSSDGDDLLVPLKPFCEAVEIGYFFDEEYNTTYCTPGAGNWQLPENYAVPVLMYHGIGHGGENDNLFIESRKLEEQIVWLLENDFTPIWFEDLWHVEDFSKPVILVFDDGWYGVYKHLYPLTEKYQVKAVAAIVEEITERRTGKHMGPEEVLEIAAHGHIAFESHGVTHQDVSGIWQKDQEPEIRDSELWLTRLIKKEPCTFVYPIGGSTPYIQDLVRQYYRFGVKMMGKLPYNTSDDPTLVYRYFIERQTDSWSFSHWMTGAFNDPSLNNYSPKIK